MDTPNTSAPVAPQAPASADIPFEALFQSGSLDGSQPTTAQDGTPQPPATPQAQPTQPEYVINAPTGTKYRTIEEATNGIVQKDTFIEQQKAEIARLTSQLQPQQQYQQQQQPQAPQPVRYAQNPKQYFADLKAAVDKGDEARYMHVQSQLFQEQMESVLGPVAPIIQDAAKQQAFGKVNIPDFHAFYGSADYNKVLESLPTLKIGIQQAENNHHYASTLPDLYKSVYEIAQARKIAETVKAQSNQQAPPTIQPQATARPAMTPSTMAPPVPAASTADWRSNPEARKALIEQGKAKGFEKLSISSL